VTFDGTPPAPEKLAVTKAPEKCGTEHVSDALMIGAGQGIRYVVVSIDKPPPGQVDTTREAEIDQQGCRFTPYAVMLPAVPSWRCIIAMASCIACTRSAKQSVVPQSPPWLYQDYLHP
jgi:hypothetical protein